MIGRYRVPLFFSLFQQRGEVFAGDVVVDEVGDALEVAEVQPGPQVRILEGILDGSAVGRSLDHLGAVQALAVEDSEKDHLFDALVTKPARPISLPEGVLAELFE